MAKIKIGGTEYVTVPLKFKQLKQAFPLIKQSQTLIKESEASGEDLDPMDAMALAIQIVAIALARSNPEMTVERIEEEIDLDECRALNTTIVEIVTESGFEAARPGEDQPSEVLPASPSTETLTA